MGLPRYYTGWQTNGPAYLYGHWGNVNDSGVINPERSLNQIKDGTAHTALYSEYIKASASGDFNPQRPKQNLYTWISNNGPQDLITGPQVASDACEANFGDSGRTFQRGCSWAWGFWTTSDSYHHVSTPNKKSCWFNAGDWEHNGFVTASSDHPGGVNMLFCDGTVRNISDNIDANIYRAIGTRDSGEKIDKTAFH
jgi:prepilin-type processing-associated H-X9-DG protein